MKMNKTFSAFCLAATCSMSLAPSAFAHSYTLSPEEAQRYGITVASIAANYDVLPYQHLLYGFQLHIDLNNATLNTNNVNTIKNATTISSHNIVRPYRVSNNKISYRISGEHNHPAVNFIDVTLDKSVLSTEHDLTIRIPVDIDVTPPDTPHLEANQTARLNVSSVEASDFLMESERTLYAITLEDGEFLQGCADPIAHSIIKTSNVQGMVRIWKKTHNRVEFIVEGGFDEPIVDNWNFELDPSTTTLNKTLHISTPIKH